MEVKFMLTSDLSLRERMVLEEYQLDNKEPRFRDQISIMSRFLVDGNGQPVPHDIAFDVVADLSGDKLEEAIQKFVKFLKEVGAVAQLPPELQRKSSSPSKTGRTRRSPSKS